ncbi:MAG: MinD/ParA family protein [Deltaproteobacteria bacterium]|jgi:flagellar biosynthesis protein FlhG|nr:MinD/ParA family protein [Deltaproteobacteria bacterium]
MTKTPLKASSGPGKTAAPPGSGKSVRVVAVSSGKGGVGKSNLTLGLAYALTSLKRRVLIWDADLGLANTDVLLGIRAERTIHDWLKGERSLKEIVIKAPGGISILPAASGILELSDITGDDKSRLLADFEEWKEELDFMLVDTAAGIGPNVVFFNQVAPERLVVVTGEPTSITDAYALIKALSARHGLKNFYVLPNMVKDLRDAKNVFKLLSDVAGNYLPDVSLDYLGFVPRDDCVPESVRRQTPFFTARPDSEASRRLLDCARTLAAKEPPPSSGGGLSLFLNRLGESSLTVN